MFPIILKHIFNETILLVKDNPSNVHDPNLTKLNLTVRNLTVINQNLTQLKQNLAYSYLTILDVSQNLT